MADIDNVVSLGMTIEGGQAEATIQRVTQGLNEMGAAGDAAATSVSDVGSEAQKTATSLQQIPATLREAQLGWLAQNRAIDAAIAAAKERSRVNQIQLDQDRENIEHMEAFTAALNGNTSATIRNAEAATTAATAQAAASTAAVATGNSFNLAGAGVGRLRQGFISLIAQTTGTIPVLDRTVGTLASMAYGSLVVTGVVGGLALIALAYEHLGKSTIEAQKALEEWMKSDDALRARSGAELSVKTDLGGTGSSSQIDVEGVSKKTDDLLKAQSALKDKLEAPDNVYIGRWNEVAEQLVKVRTAYEQGAMGAAQFQAQIKLIEAQHPDYAPQIAQTAAMAAEWDKLTEALRRATAAEQEHDVETKALAATYGQSYPEALRQLDRLNQEAIALQTGGTTGLKVKKEDFSALDDAKKLWGEYTQSVQGASHANVAFQDALAGKGGKDAQTEAERALGVAQQIVHLQDQIAQGPKGISQENRADDTATRFRDELKQLQSESTSFGKDDAVDIRMKAFIDRIDQAKVALERLHQANTAPQIAALDAVKAAVPDLTDAFKAKNQTEFNTTVDARIAKMREENAAQQALDIARGQSVDAINAVMVANAGSIAVEAEQARATQLHTTLTKAQADAIRQLAEEHEREAIAAKTPQRFATEAHDVVGEAQQNTEQNTGSSAADLQRITAYYVDAVDYLNGLVRGTLDWKTANEAVNALFKERKTLEVAVATKPLTDIVQPALLTQLQTEIGDAGGASKAQRAQLDAIMKTAREEAIAEATKEAAATMASNKPLDEKLAILAKIHQELQSIGALKPEQGSILGLLAGGLHQLGDIANVLHDSGLGNLLGTAGNAITNIGAARDAASAAKAANPGAALGGFASLAAITPDVAAVTSVVALATEIFGKSAVQTEWHTVMAANTAAIAEMTLKLSGFTVNAGNTLAAAAGIAAFEADPNAVAALKDNRTQKGGLFSGRFSDTAGGDLQSQINALGPYLNQIFGPTSTMAQMDGEWTKLVAIAKQYGITLTDSQGRIIPAALASLSSALTTAAQAAFTLTNTFSNVQSVFNLQSKAQDLGVGVNQNHQQLDNAFKAFLQTLGPANAAAAGLSNVDPNSAAGQAAIRAYATAQANAEATALKQTGAASLPPGALGSFQSIGDFNNALNAILDPLNAMTNAINGAVAAFTNLPTGFRAAQAAYDLYKASPLLTQAPGTVPPATSLPTTLQTTQVPAITVQGPVYITPQATNVKDLLTELATELKSSAARGGTTQASLAIRRMIGQVS